MSNKKVSLIIGLVIMLTVILTMVLVTMDRQNIEELPSYTDYKQDIIVDGFKYEEQPHLGDPAAKVKIFEFADFKCPACKQWTEENFSTLKKEYIDTGKVEFFFMNYAFLDRDSILAGIAGEAVFKQSNDKFWEFYEHIFKKQGDESEIWATPSFLLSLIKKNISGLDIDQLEHDITNHVFLPNVKEDYKIGGFYGVNGSPTFIVNGKIVRSNAYKDIQEAIEHSLRQ